MARFSLKPRDRNKDLPPVSDDFIYDDPDASSSSLPSDTPEEALRKLRGDHLTDNPHEASSSRSTSAPSSIDPDLHRPSSKRARAVSDADDSFRESSRSVSSPSGFVSDSSDLDSLSSSQEPPSLSSRRRTRNPHPRLRIFVIVLVTVFLVLLSGVYIFHRIIPDVELLSRPETMVAEAVTPVQSFFSGITESIASLFRSYKLRSNIEAEYNALRAENEQLVYKAMLADELQQTLSQYEDLSDEIAANAAMRPIVCTVIGKSDSNYFSTFTINKGSDDGVEDYMAVTISGSLVGYTESVQPSSATVRTIIDSEASIAALISSSRDQGTVRGTLGVDGTPMCRMYYLPDDNLPRPGDTVVTSGVGMSFPKGIPIGIVRESTRGMESNKQYIVLEPLADFQHLEYVIVLRYKPVAEAIQGRENGRSSLDLVPLESARPSPQVPQIASSLFEVQSTQDPEATPTLSPEPTFTPEPSPSPTPIPTPTPEVNNLEYNVVNPRGEPTPTLTPTPVPTPTPYLTPDPDAMTFEEDDA